MTDIDMVPVKDPGGGKNDGFEQKAAQQRRMVSKWDRDTLEDKYLRMYEENLILKKHARKQEDKIKRMATKLLRLVNDKKKNSEIDVGVKKGRDIEMEEKIEEFQDHIRDLEKQNVQLKEKLMLTKQQLATTGKRSTPYNRVGSRIDTGIAKTGPDSRLTRNIRVVGPQEGFRGHPISHMQSLPQQRGNQGLIEHSRAELRQKDDHIAQLHEQLNMCEMEIENLRQQIKMKDSDYEEDLLKIKQQITAEQRATVQENIDLIKLQREVKEKSTKLSAVTEKYAILEENLHTVKRSHDNMLMEMENLNMQLKEEQNRVLTLQNELKFGTTNNRKIIELQEQISCMEKENQILKEANEKFVSSAFDLEREREWRQRENQLKVQIAQLEATLKADLGEKGGIIDKYAIEKETHEQLQAQFREMQLEHYQLKEEYDDLKEKMKFFTKESAIDFSEIEEALVLVKQKKQQSVPDPDFLQRVDREMSKDEHRKLLEVQAEYAECIHELEKTRNMLVIQHKINKDYQQEVDISQSKIDEIKKEYETKLDEYARLLDIRAARIKKLEAQLRDVAYGTKQYKVPPPTDSIEDTIDFDETIHLERGQNLFEIHVQKVSLSPEAIKLLGDEEALVFCTWEFFEFEIQSTPVLKGPRPEYDFTSQYVVKVDDFFLHYLQRESCTLELHQSLGQDFNTIGACQLVFKDIFDKPHGRIHGSASLTGLDGEGAGMGFGVVEYWIRLRVPMEQALRLYKERTKALGYVMSNQKAATEALQALDENAAMRPKDNINELHIKIVHCSGLKSRRPNVQPSPYCVYQFYDNRDHDTTIIRNSNNPEFNDHKTFPVPMTADLDQFLKTTPLRVFVFDDVDPEQASYIGIADVPLIPLAHNKAIKGLFELKAANGRISGTIELELRWQFTYVPPKGMPLTEPPPTQDVKPEEPTTLNETLPVTPAPTKTRMAAKFPGPSATSTPMPKSQLTDSTMEGFVKFMDVDTTPKTPAKKKLDVQEESIIQPSESLVHEAVSQVVSDNLPSMLSTESMSNAPPAASPASSMKSTPRAHSDEGKQKPIPKARKTLTFRLDMKEETLTPKAGTKASDTMFGDEDEEIEEEITEEVTDRGETLPLPQPSTETEEEESEKLQMETDSEGIVVMNPKPKRRGKAVNKAANSVTVTISHLSLNEHAAVLNNDNVRQLFVAYNFLGIEPQDLETPFSLPKPKANNPITYNFTKTFQVDMQKNYERRQYLAGMLLPDDPEQGRIRFTVVSEPPDDDMDAECEDIGVAFVSVKEILMTKKDVEEQNVDLHDVKNEQNVIGTLNVTLKCLAALEAVEKEMQIEGTY
ncbi:protein fantom-like isoform X2 [Ostrea edulis]|uniref:protein fantom-like isoform X2 n=1 Tax=Ostrea edulis TaxID=37623 RepID=UPI0024AF0B9E|nr:protein fantom-like isoform X2 [Ostrea edulis]